MCREEGTIVTRDIRENKMKTKPDMTSIKCLQKERRHSKEGLFGYCSAITDRRAVILVSLVLNQAVPGEMSLRTPKRKESSEEAAERQEIVMVSDAR